MFRLFYLLLLLGLLLLLLRQQLFLLISVLFGTTFQELLGKVLGLRSVSQIGPDVVMHLIRRIQFLQEGCKRWNWQEDKLHNYSALRPPGEVDHHMWLEPFPERNKLGFTIQIVGCVERVQGLLTPLHKCVLLALTDTLEQL